MTYDPDRDPRTPRDVNLDARPYGARQSNGLGIMLGLLAALMIGAFLFYSMNRPANVATDGRPDAKAPATTTGAGPGTVRDTGTGTNPPAAQKPTPAAPAPRQ